MKARARVIFKGRVQGVFFRQNTEEKALELGLKGWVRNLRDGSVEALFEGEKETIEKIIEWCKYKQPYAKVSSAMVTWEEYRGEYDDFSIVY